MKISHIKASGGSREEYVIGEDPPEAHSDPARPWHSHVYWRPAKQEATIPNGDFGYTYTPCHSLLEAIAIYERWRNGSKEAR